MRKIITMMLVLMLSVSGTGTGAIASEGAEGEAAAPVPEFEYLQMDPMTLPIITDRGLTQQVSLVVSLEVPYGKKIEVEPYEPRLADAYLQDLYGALGSGQAMMKGNVVDIQAVKQRLTDITTKIIGAEKFNSVLLQVVQQRAM